MNEDIDSTIETRNAATHEAAHGSAREGAPCEAAHKAAGDADRGGAPREAAHGSDRGGAPAHNDFEFFASCLSGLEASLADELKQLGAWRVRPLSGGVSFIGEPVCAYRACLWSRLASRIMLVLGRVNAGDADLLYAGVYDMPWEDILADDASMAVRTHGSNDQLRDSRFTSLKVKDAIVDRMRAKRNERPNVDSKAPRAAVDVRLRDTQATISLDLSGEALNHRTYLAPDDSDDAALECSLAAGLLALSGWSDLAQTGAGFVDPVCGNGILLVEAASIACDMAPGLLRTRWGFYGWSGFDEDVWADLLAEADERFERGLAHIAGEAALSAKQNARPDTSRVRIVGASASSPAISRARDHVRRAGLRQAVSVELGDAESASELVGRVKRIANKYAPANEVGMLVASNVEARAAGKRAGLAASEAAFVAASEAAPAGSTFAVLGGVDVHARFGVSPAIDIKLGRGRVQTSACVYEQGPQAGIVIEIPDSHGGAPHKVEVLEASSEQFASRLRKVLKERRKWAKRTGVSCYRVYDSDLPDYAVAIDVYEGSGEARGNTYLHISEYAAPSSIDADRARHRFNDVLAVAPVVCDVRPDHVFSKTRSRDKGGSQYRNAGTRAYVTTVQENGFTFEVDLAGRLDTGLFLDHRLTRQLVRDEAHDARFLNLFAYTGTATVYAAAGGAYETTTVDLSATYLEWAERNMHANGFDGPQHEYVRADVMKWITDARRAGRKFELIFVDPPTFSNSKAMGRRTWDVQRDHVELLISVSRLLSDDGVAVFSCNLRNFKPYCDDLEKYGVELEDISAKTIPEDFARTPKVHKCYIVRRSME